MKPNIHIWSYLAQLFLEWEMFRLNFIEKFKKRILCSVTVFKKSLVFWGNVDKFCRAEQATDDNYGACGWHAG